MPVCSSRAYSEAQNHGHFSQTINHSLLSYGVSLCFVFFILSASVCYRLVLFRRDTIYSWNCANLPLH